MGLNMAERTPLISTLPSPHQSNDVEDGNNEERGRASSTTSQRPREDHYPTKKRLHSISIKERPRASIWMHLHAILFNLFFGLQMVLIHTVQLCVLPLYLIPIGPIRRMYYRAQHWAKSSFSSALLIITTLFAPTTLIITADETIDLDHLIKYDSKGRFQSFHFKKQSVWIANHQQYCDWMFAWMLFALANIDKGIIIVLKASLRWVPVVGPAMQLFQFEFIDKKRRLQDSDRIFNYAKRTQAVNLPFTLTLFPEGTLFSALTQPKSAAFAKAQGVPEFDNMLLPRSTGLLYCLRPLVSIMPELELYDLTIGYEGVPARGYAQSYYTLEQWFAYRTPSPRVHLHFHSECVSALPLGQGLGTNHLGKTAKELDQSTTEEERKLFQHWTMNRWAVKDRLMTEFYERGQFPVGDQGSRQVPMRARAVDWLVMASVPIMLAVIALTVGSVTKFALGR